MLKATSAKRGTPVKTLKKKLEVVTLSSDEDYDDDVVELPRRPTKFPVLLNTNFVMANFDRTVLAYAFKETKNGWEKVENDEGDYFSIIGFTDNKDYHLTLPENYEVYSDISYTPKEFIVVQQQGNYFPSQISKNGEFENYRLYVDNVRPDEPLNQTFALKYINETVLCFMFEKTRNGLVIVNTRGKFHKIIGFTADNIKGVILSIPSKYIVLQSEDTGYIIINNSGDDISGAYKIFAEPPAPVRDNTPKYYPLNVNFVLSNIDRTVFSFTFEKTENGWEKQEDDDGTYYKIIGFTNNAYFDIDEVPPKLLLLNEPHDSISKTPQQYIVLHDQGTNNAIVIENNGNIDESRRVFVTATN
jgi:hypothetical protein